MANDQKWYQSAFAKYAGAGVLAFGVLSGLGNIVADYIQASNTTIVRYEADSNARLICTSRIQHVATALYNKQISGEQFTDLMKRLPEDSYCKPDMRVSR